MFTELSLVYNFRPSLHKNNVDSTNLEGNTEKPKNENILDVEENQDIDIEKFTGRYRMCNGS